MNNSQMMKGILEGCILKIIGKLETYGYGIGKELQKAGFTDIKEGTLYPLLLRLEKKKLIIATSKPSPLGPRRKYYNLTNEGKEYVKDFYRVWREMSESVERIFKEKEAI